MEQLSTAQSGSGRRASEAAERMCLGCRTRRRPAQMIRFVAGPDGLIVIDQWQRMPGRGAYLSVRPACVQSAVKRRALQRSLDGRLSVGEPDILLEEMRRAAQRRFLDRLGLARRAGAIASGTEAVREAMKANAARLIILATDASAGARAQLVANAERKEMSWVDGLDGARLAKTIGLDYVTAVAVTQPPFDTDLRDLSSCLVEDCRKVAERSE